MEFDHKQNVMTEMKWTNDWTRDAEAPNREFLFLLEKTGTVDGVHADECEVAMPFT